MKILELGCGGKHHKGTTHCYDYNKSLKCKNLIQEDFNEKETLPYKDNFFDKVNAYEFMEHVVRVEKLLKEVRRVIKLGGLFEFTVPHANSLSAWCNPEHKHCFMLITFNDGDYWMKGWKLINKHYYTNIPDIQNRISTWISNKFGKWSEIFFPWMNKYTGLKFVLKKVKVK